MEKTNPEPIIALGRLVATPGALAALTATGTHPLELLSRHACGDWGVLCAEDRRANDCAVAEGERILSAYRLLDGTKLWVITEWDRSATTILRPDEY